VNFVPQAFLVVRTDALDDVWTVKFSLLAVFCMKWEDGFKSLFEAYIELVFTQTPATRARWLSHEFPIGGQCSFPPRSVMLIHFAPSPPR